jgi:uncharacterized membrane-anchored protein
MRPSFRAIAALFTVVAAFLWLPARQAFAAPRGPKAKTAPAPKPQPSAAPAPASDDAAVEGDAEPAVTLHWTNGPATIELGHDAKLALPAERRFLGPKEAADVMAKMGNLHNENLLGLVVSADPASDYLVSIRYEDEGYVKDDETINAKELLDAIVEGEPEYNEERQKAGFAPLHALGWSEEPKYDGARHEVVWALLLESDGAKTVNLNTRVLGRRGYLSVNLMTDPDSLPRYRGDGLALVNAATFDIGSRYEDFDKSKDRVAEYGLAGLILGGVGLGVAIKATKLGLLAGFWKPILGFLVAAKKLVVAGFVAVGAAIKRLFGRKERKPTVIS